MAVGSMRKWVGLWSLVGALTAGACGDDDTLKDSGTEKDSGEEEPDAAEDAGGTASDGGETDAGVQAVMCGGKTCMGHSVLGMITIEPGCAENVLGEEVCGLSSQLMLMGQEPKFLERNAPGAESPGCGEFFDAREAEPDGGVMDGGTKGNGRVDLTLVGRTVSLPGCCTKKGLCSADFANGKIPIAGVLIDLDTGFGCMDPEVLFREDAEEARNAACDPDTGELILAEDAGADAEVDAGADAQADDGG
jgi:hypothetical protein